MILAAFVALSAAVCATPLSDDQDFRSLADEMERHLDRHILNLWYPRAVDRTSGGFQEGFDEQWRPNGSADQRSIVYQSRLTWVAAEVMRRYPNRAAEYRNYALHGAKALRERMWDGEKGGFYWQVNAATREPASDRGGEKHAYGNAFGIYALANVYLATKDQDAIEFAKRAFRWLDDNAHDSRNGGYYEALTREGKPILSEPSPGRRDAIGTKYGLKSMNSHIHLLEAFTELHKAWPDRRVKRRLGEVFKIVRDKVYSEPGYLHLYLTQDWKPVPDHDSFGHDVETAYLLLEAEEELTGHTSDRTREVARKLVDHSLQVGWDDKHGGFYDHGGVTGPATGLDKVWWTQAEGLNALLVAASFIQRSDDAVSSDSGRSNRYVTAFKRQWDFITNHQLDPKHGGWISSVSADGKAKPGQNKSDMWKDPYHQARAVMNVIARLRKMSRAK